MQLARWLENSGVSVAAFAKRWQLERTSTSRMVRGERQPTFTLMVAAHVHTDGAVTIDDWIALHAPSLRAEGLPIGEQHGTQAQII